MIKKILYVIMCVMILSTLDTGVFAESSSGGAPQVILKQGDESPNGSYAVEVYTQKGWKTAGSLPFGQFYSERPINLSSFITEGDVVKVRISQQDGGAAQIDSVFLGGSAPSEVNGTDGFLVQKLSKKDYDVINVDGDGIEVEFPAGTANGMLLMTARIESLDISKEPFQFPVENTYTQIGENSKFYTYSLNAQRGALNPDGQIGEVSGKAPFFKEYRVPGTGHPAGYTYGWVMNDDKNLYVTMDFTPDDTMDGDKDYASVHVKTPQGVKEFKVSVSGTEWGMAGFIYTDKVAYQHKVYEFKIPLEELGVTNPGQAGSLQLAFTAYGTAAEPALNTDYYYQYDKSASSPNHQDIKINANWYSPYYYLAGIDCGYFDLNDNYTKKTLGMGDFAVEDFEGYSYYNDSYYNHTITINKKYLSSLQNGSNDFTLHFLSRVEFLYPVDRNVTVDIKHSIQIQTETTVSTTNSALFIPIYLNGNDPPDLGRYDSRDRVVDYDHNENLTSSGIADYPVDSSNSLGDYAYRKYDPDSSIYIGVGSPGISPGLSSFEDGFNTVYINFANERPSIYSYVNVDRGQRARAINNVGDNDIVAVRYLNDGDVVKLYRTTGAALELIDTDCHINLGNEIDFFNLNLGTSPGSIYYTITSAGSAEGEPTELEYSQERLPCDGMPSIAPDVRDIAITNNEGNDNDTIEVRNLHGGDIVKVYGEPQGSSDIQMFEFGIMSSVFTGTGSLVLAPPEGWDFYGGTVYVTVTNPGKLESSYVPCNYPVFTSLP